VIHGTASFAARITDDDGIEIAIGGPVVNPHDKQRRGAGVYCVVPSGEDGAATREACLAAGADEVFCKPLRRSTSAAG